MGAIQGSINQLLGQAQIATQLSPELRAKAEERADMARTVNQGKRASEAVKVIGEKPGTLTANDTQFVKELTSKAVNASKSRFSLKPTSYNYEALEGDIETANRINAAAEKEVADAEKGNINNFHMVAPADPEEIMQERAELEAQKKLELEQKRITNSRNSAMGRQLMANAPQVNVSRTKIDLNDKETDNGNK